MQLLIKHLKVKNERHVSIVSIHKISQTLAFLPVKFFSFCPLLRG